MSCVQRLAGDVRTDVVSEMRLSLYSFAPETQSQGSLNLLRMLYMHVPRARVLINTCSYAPIPDRACINICISRGEESESQRDSTYSWYSQRLLDKKSLTCEPSREQNVRSTKPQSTVTGR